MADRLRRRGASPCTPAWQEAITGVPAAAAERIGREFAPQRRGVPRPLHDHHGGRDQPLLPLRHDLPGVPGAGDADRLPGPQRRRLGALRGPGEGPPGHRARHAGDGHGLAAAAAADDRHRVLVPGHRPVALRHVRRRHVRLAGRPGPVRRHDHRRPARPVGPARLDAVVPDLQLEPAGPRRRGGALRSGAGRVRDRGTGRRAAAVRRRGPGRAGELPAGADRVAGEPARLLGQGQRVLPQAPARRVQLGPGAGRHRRASVRATSPGARRRPRASSTCCWRWTSG